MQKLLLAINQKDAEKEIQEKLKDNFLCVAAVPYREAIFQHLKEQQIDVLIIRETLEGGIPVEELIDRIRNESPRTRIVFISRHREKKDAFLADLVNFGIYDIINKDQVSIDEIVSYVRDPRTFRDVSMYRRKSQAKRYDTEKRGNTPAPEKKQGLFSSLLGKGKEKGSQESKADQIVNNTVDQPYDIDTMRKAMEEAANRKAQEGVDELIKKAVEDAKKEQEDTIKKQEEEIGKLKKDLRTKTDTAEHDRTQANEYRLQMDKARDLIKQKDDQIKKLTEEHAEEIGRLAKTETPKWFTEKLGEKDAEIERVGKSLTQSNQMVQSLTEDINKAREQIRRLEESTRSSTPDLQIKAELNKTQELLQSAKQEISNLQAENKELRENPAAEGYSPLADGEPFQLDMENYLEPPGDIHNIVFLGAKHGVGNTTAALNTAVTIAKQGYSVMLMEFNMHFPMLNHIFEFINITNGIDTACDGILSNNTQAIDKAIIRPHQLAKHSQRKLARAYKKLPAGLHMMLFSNQALTDHPTINQRSLKDLFYYLSMQLKYSFIIIDLQPDDQDMLDLVLRSGFLADKLLVTITQDTHSIVSAEKLLTDLSNGRSANLAKSAHILLNKYEAGASIKKGDIMKWMSLPSKRVICLTDDPVVYLDANSYGIPYACSRSQHAGDYNAVAKAAING